MLGLTPTHYTRLRLQIRSERINKLTLPIAACILLAASTAFAQSSVPFPGGELNSATLRIQERVEELFQDGDYERAHFIYLHELVPIGDKYAQYMLGFMYLTGTGVNEDPLQASAWYRLAAERDHPEFMTVRDQLVSTFSDIDKIRSDQLFLELRRDYSDVVILLGLVREDVDLWRARTGSRLPVGTSPVTIVDPGNGRTVSADEYFHRLGGRIEARLRFMAKRLGDDSLDTDASDLDLDRLRVAVTEYVETINDR